MDEKYDVVMFYGPPFGGKTAHFHHVLSSTHQRVSATELFQENPDMGLRQVILKVASLLRDGHKVVIDDENWTKATRTSYVKALSAKFPKCKFLCVKFNPEELVSYWSMEWYLAEKVLHHHFSHMIFDVKKATRKLHHWYSKSSDVLKLEEPKQEERMTIKMVKSNLLAQVDYKFEVPALFIQWEAVLVSSDGRNSIHKGLEEVINYWLNTNPWGRVIIVFDSGIATSGSTNSESSEDLSIDSYKPLLKRLCQDITVPVYIVQNQTPASDRKFCHPPQPGILAFLQRLHLLHLFHRYTLYLYCTNVHYKMADEAGVRHAPAKTVLCNPQMIVSSRCAAKVAVKPELKDINFKPTVRGHSSSPEIPLIANAKESTLEGQWGYYEELYPWKYMHGICFHDLSVVERYQQLYADTASRLSETGSRMINQHSPDGKTPNPAPQAPVPSSNTTTDKAGCQTAISQTSRGSRAIPSWLMSKNSKQQKKVDDLDQAASPSLDSSLEDQPVTKKKKTAAQPSTIYCMNVLELLETAQLVLVENGGSVSSNVTKTSTDTKHTRSKPCDSAGAAKQEVTHKPSAIPTTSSSTQQKQQHHVVPEMIAKNPETEGHHQSIGSASTTDMSEIEDAPLKSDEYERHSDMVTRKTNAAKSGPDLSFLDDIF